MSDSDVSYFESSGEEDGPGQRSDLTNFPRPFVSWSDVPFPELESNAQSILAVLTGTDVPNAPGGHPLDAAGRVDQGGQPGRPAEDRPTDSGGLESVDLTGLTHKQLVALRNQSLQQSIQHQTHLRQFVKHNFAQTIQTIDTVSKVAAGVRELSMDVGDAEANTSGAKSAYQALASSIVALDADTEEAFRGYVQRVSMSENLNTVVQLFGANDDLIILPSRIRGRAEEGDWEGFVKVCERAAAALREAVQDARGVGQLSSSSSSSSQTSQIWVKLEEEVMKAAEGGVAMLLGRMLRGNDTTLRSVPLAIHHAAEAACYVERLKRVQGLNLSNIRDMDVLNAFVESQVAGAIGSLRASVDTGKTTTANGTNSSSDEIGQIQLAADISRATVAWCREYWEMCERLDGMRKRDAGNAPFVELLVASESREETNTPRRVFSGYSAMLEACVSRGIQDACYGSDPGGISELREGHPIRSSTVLLDGLRRIVRAGERAMAVLNEVWGPWCTDEDQAGARHAQYSRRSRGLSRRSAGLESAPSVSMLIPLTPQIRDLFSHVIECVFHVLGDYMRTRIAPNVFSLRERNRSDQAAAAIGLPNAIRINLGFVPRANIALLRTAIDEAMCCTAVLGKQARLLQVPIQFKANAYLKAVADACSASIVKYIDVLPLSASVPLADAPVGLADSVGHDVDREREQNAEHVDEFILLGACQTLESIKTAVLPEIVTVHSAVLHLGNATSTENSDAFKWCCTHLEDGQEVLMKRWVEIKLQKLEPIMSVVLGSSATDDPRSVPCSAENCSTGGPHPAIRELMIILKGYDADISLMMPSLRDEVMGDIYLAVAEGWVGAENARGLQAWVDAKAMKTWMVSQLGSDDTEIEALLSGVMETIEADLHLDPVASGELVNLKR